MCIQRIFLCLLSHVAAHLLDMNVNMTNLALTGQLSPEGLPPIRVQNWCRYDQGDSVLENRDFFTESWVKWLDLGVLVGCIAVFWIGMIYSMAILSAHCTVIRR